MKAILWTKYGNARLLKVGQIEKPKPKDDELLIRVFAATVTPGDCEIRRFDIHVLFWLPLRIYMGIFKPKRPVLGMELSGEVVSVGSGASNFKPGDQIVSDLGIRFGAHAEYACVKSSHAMSRKPVNVSFEEAATLPTGGLNALNYLRKGNIQQGQKVLIAGAGGCFGTYAIQLAKLQGAEVTAVDHTNKLDALKELSADHLIDYTKEDYTQNRSAYDVIFDIVRETSVWKGMNALKPKGIYLLANPWVGEVLRGMVKSRMAGKKFIFSLANYTKEDLEHLVDLVESGKLKPVVDTIFSMDEIIEAHEYVEGNTKIGHVAIKVR